MCALVTGVQTCALPIFIGGETSQSREEKEWSGTLKAAYRWNDSVMTYLSAARGYKGGGFNLDRVQSSNGLTSGGTGILPVHDPSFGGAIVDSNTMGAKTPVDEDSRLLPATPSHQKTKE